MKPVWMYSNDPLYLELSMKYTKLPGIVTKETLKFQQMLSEFRFLVENMLETEEI
jgi:hypothetical protein